MSQIKNIFFEENGADRRVAKYWHINPETKCNDYDVIETMGPRGEVGRIQVVRGYGRSAEYVWQKFDVRDSKNLAVKAILKTVGDTTAQIRLFLEDASGNVLKRAMSDFVLSDTDWTCLELRTTVPNGCVRGTVYAISFTSGGKGEAWWWQIDVYETVTTDTSDVGLRTVGDRCGHPQERVLPTPKEMDLTMGVFHISNETLLCVSPRSRLRAIRAASHMQSVLMERLGMPLDICTSVPDPTRSSVILAFVDDLPSLRTQLGVQLPDVPNHEEGYVVYVADHFCVCAARTERGLFYATQTLIQMIPDEGDLAICGCIIRDWPTLPRRCVNIFLDFLSLDHMRELVNRMIARLKFNTVVLECSMVRWHSHPEIWQPEAGTRVELRAVQQMLADAYLDIVPLVQSLGHCSWLFYHGRNLDICEDETVPYAYNPLAPRTYDVVFDIYQEVIDLLNPTAFHIGHDEVRMRGTFPKSDKGKVMGFSKLFVDDVNRLAEFLLQQGIRPWMWADVVLGEALASQIELLPREIVMVDWQYVPFQKYASTEFLKASGFDVLGATWWNPKNIQTFSEYVERIGAMGMLQTTWLGHFASAKWMSDIQQYEAHVYAAEHFWAGSAVSRGEYVNQIAREFVLNALPTRLEASIPDWGEHW